VPGLLNYQYPHDPRVSGLGGLLRLPQATIPIAAGNVSQPAHGLGMLSPSNAFAAGSIVGPGSNALAGLLQPVSAPGMAHWIAVHERFRRFDETVALTAEQQRDGQTKYAGVVSRLNREYYRTDSGNENSFRVGSWSKGTAVRPPRDVDVYFLLPFPVYSRFERYAWNKQSALLQEVKEILKSSFPNTDLRADGQVVVVNFESFGIEVVPAFRLMTQGRYWICDTSTGGSYKETAPWNEVEFLNNADLNNAKNARPMIRMLKTWQYSCDVPIKSFHLELLATEFLAQSPWRLKNWFYFDWLMRDFFVFLFHRAHGTIIVPGTSEVIFLGNAWQSYATSAYRRAARACDLEYENRIFEAGEEWQKIFGSMISRTI
jgi:Second Messenger Oligonucleotide or Dinucleotide Synthetase domain